MGISLSADTDLPADGQLIPTPAATPPPSQPLGWATLVVFEPKLLPHPGGTVQKSDREIMDILEALDLTRCADSAADLAGCDPSGHRAAPPGGPRAEPSSLSAGRRCTYRPWVTEPGMWLQVDCPTGPAIGSRPTLLFCA